MVGHGRPVGTRGALVRHHHEPVHRLRTILVRLCVLAATFVLHGGASPLAEAYDVFSQLLRVRVACGGTEPHRWSGTVRFEGATVDDLQLLSLDADAAAGVWLDGNTIHFEPPRPRRHEAVDVTVSGTAEARLIIEMRPDANTPPVTKEFPLVDALHSHLYLPLDELGTGLVVERAPGDELRINTSRDSLIFAPGEQFTFDVEPLVDGIAPGTSIDVDATMTAARSSATRWNHRQRLSVPLEGPAIATVHVPLPRQEGVYAIRLAVSRPAGFSERFLPGGRNKPLAERLFQVVVLQPDPTPPAADATWQTILDIDPANPRWWERLPSWTQIRRIRGVAPQPLGSLRAEAVDEPLGRFVRLPETPVGGEMHWQAYALSLPPESLGMPHLLEVEYPNDKEQHLGLSILEPNAAGRIVPIERDSGVYVEGIGHAEQVEKHTHRIVFWPRTESPLLLVTNQHPTAAARFGNIRVLRHTTDSLATLPWPSTQPSGRLVANYFARPLVPETFGASEGRDVVSGESVDDWQTFYESATRLAEYANYAGYNASVASVLADGGAVYRGDRILSTPRYNTGRLVSAARDLPAIDPLELQLRIFDRSNLAFVPMLQFAAPLPELEDLRRGTDPQTSGLELIGAAGLPWPQTHASDRGLAPYYNVLDPRVQRAMLNVVHELVENYGNHSAFAGLAVQLCGNGYATIPGLEWGLDDATVERFERDTGIELPDDAPNRFVVRYALLTGKHADAWRDWRATQLTKFYRQMAMLVRSSGPQRRLLLTTDAMFNTPELSERFRPRVSAKPRIDRAMQELGIDRAELSETPGIVVCPTSYVESMVPLVDRAVELGINEAFADAPKLETENAAVVLYHPPQRRRLPSFDVKSPYPATTRLVVQSSADAARARRPYAAAFRGRDPQVLLEGGELLPLGQEDATRHLREILRRIPDGPATTVQRAPNVTVRNYDDGGGSLLVVVNECPWTAELDVTLNVPTDTTADPLAIREGKDLSEEQQTFAAGRQSWTLLLAGYDVHAMRFSSRGVQVENVVSTISDAGRQELDARLSELVDRDLGTAQIYAGLENPGFEPMGGPALVGWQPMGDPLQTRAELDNAAPIEGNACVHLRNRAQAGTAVLASNTFTTPPTGQLVMTVHVRGENVPPATELRMVFESEGNSNFYREFTILGGQRPGAQPIGNEWDYWAFRRENLPLDSRGKMRIKFELTGPGDVWIDDVRLHQILFPLGYYPNAEKERLELTKLLHSADSAADSGDLAECVQQLEGYWPRFLNEYTPLSAPAVASQPPIQTPPQVEKQQAPAEETARWWDPRRFF